MKPLLYIAVAAFLVSSCTTTRNLTNTMEDDIYYVPGQKSLVVQEVENLTGQDLSNTNEIDSRILSEEISRSTGSSTAPAAFSTNAAPVINRRSGKVEQVSVSDLTTQAQEMLANNEEINSTLYENTGYWLGGYKGPESDLEEIQRIINLYPEGFAYFNSNGQDIAFNLSFDPDWNVYTDNGRYWWFPSNTNINLYSSLLFGTYPKYIWTVIWDNPGFDSWAFNSSFNSGFNSGFNLGLNVGWGTPGWSFGFGWNSGWNNPWYNGWYGWGNPWYDPWYRPWYGYYPGWGHPHWHHPHWDRPHWGNGSHSPNRPFRPSIRPNFNNAQRPSANTNRPSNSRPGTSIRPGSGSATRPNGNMVRPGTSGTTRPVARPTTVRPNSSRPGSTVRPQGTMSRPNTTTTRPGSVTRPNVNRPGSSTRPNTTRPNTTRPSTTLPSTTTRPNSTRPSTTTRPNSSTTRRPSGVSRPATNSNRYTRPATTTRSTNNRSNVRNYSRPQNSYRPTYNNNSTSRYNPGSSYSRSQNRGNSGSYSPGRSSSNSRSSSSARPATSRPARR